MEETQTSCACTRRDRTQGKLELCRMHRSNETLLLYKNPGAVPYIESTLDIYPVCRFRVQALVMHSIDRSKSGCAYTVETGAVPCSIYARQAGTTLYTTEATLTEPRQTGQRCLHRSNAGKAGCAQGHRAGCACQGTTEPLYGMRGGESPIFLPIKTKKNLPFRYELAFSF